MQLDNEPQEIFDALKECSWILMMESLLFHHGTQKQVNLVEDGTRSNI